MTPHRGGEIDTTRPNQARVYDYLLGGTANFPADREQAARLTDPRDGYPGLRAILRDNREFIIQAVTWLASGAGVRAGLMKEPVTQFLDLGCGLPARPSVHETALAADPSARIIYVDHDPVVLDYVRALAVSEDVAAVGADLTEPEAVLGTPALKEAVDLEQPACVILACVLHFLPAGAAEKVVARYMDQLPAGSCAVVSVCRYDDEELAARLAGKYRAGTWRNHSADDVQAMLGGLRLVRGQMADVRRWPLPPPRISWPASTIGGVGIKG